MGVVYENAFDWECLLASRVTHFISLITRFLPVLLPPGVFTIILSPPNNLNLVNLLSTALHKHMRKLTRHSTQCINNAVFNLAGPNQHSLRCEKKLWALLVQALWSFKTTPSRIPSIAICGFFKMFIGKPFLSPISFQSRGEYSHSR